MSLLEVVIALSIGLAGALGLNLAWSQSLALEQQLQQARASRAEAMQLLYRWQAAPRAGMETGTSSILTSSTANSAGAYQWQLSFANVAAQAHWQGIWRQSSACVQAGSTQQEKER